MTVRLALLTEIISPYRIPVFNALARREGIDLHVIFLAETDATQRQWLVYKSEIQFSYEVLPAWRWRWHSWHILLNRGMWRALSHFGPDSILCGGYNHSAFWHALAWSKLHSTHFVAWIESTTLDQRKSNPITPGVKRFFVRNCSAVVVPGRSSFEYVRSMGVPADKIYTAPNAVDNHLFANLASSTREREPQSRSDLGLPPRYFLYAGRIIPEKGIVQLLEAYTQLPADLRSQVGLVLVGEGTGKKDLMERAAKIHPGSIIFPGFAQREQLAAFYALAEVLVFPTLSDPWGLVVNEAMACGLPIIATNVAGCTADLVQNEQNGFVVPAGNVGELAQAMAAFARDQKLASRMGACSARLIELFSPESCAAGLAASARF
jgi:glycosyltransferase involved in cell wall biosynthesis